MATAIDPSTSSKLSDEAVPPSASSAATSSAETSSASTNEAECPSTSTNQAGASSIIIRSKCISRLGDPSLFDVLSIIFKYSSARDLRRSSMVCRTWADAAQQKLAIRPARFEWEALFRRLMPAYINHVFRSDPEPLDAYVHAFYRNDLKEPSPDGINRHPDTTNLDRASSDADRFADDYFGSMRNVPQLTLCFASAEANLEKQVHDALMRKRPKDSHVITICSTTGVTCTAKRPNGEITMEFDRKGHAISLVSMPVHPGFRCYVHAFHDLPDGVATARGILNRLPPQDRKRVKGMLAFTESAPNAVALVYKTLRDEYKRTRDFKGKFTRGTGASPKIAFAGGICRELHVNGVDETNSENVVVFLCGDDRLGIESFVLKRTCNDKLVVETKITEFAEAIKAKLSPDLTQGIGLQCACLGRGEPFYNSWNVESDAFRKNFPDFPVFGFFGDGELGCDSEPLQLKGKPDENVEHSYCTVFMVIACTDK